MKPAIIDTSQPMSRELFRELADFVAARMGLSFPESRWADLERGIQRMAGQMDFGNVADCARWLLTSPLSQQNVELLASHLTIGETYFFREPESFEALATHVLPSILASRSTSVRRLRMWSAGCSSGEEAYSIAMLLDRCVPDIDDWDISLLATDINPDFLARAQRGIYREWSFRGLADEVIFRNFTKRNDGTYEIAQRLRDKVTFSYLNLAEDEYPALLNNTNAMDIIFCRNVLMYFQPEHATEVVKKLRSCLYDDGWLVLGNVESMPYGLRGFASVRQGEKSFYRKLPDSVLHPASSPVPVLDAVPTGPLPRTVPQTAPRSRAAVPMAVRPPAVRTAEAAANEARDQAAAAYREGRYDIAMLRAQDWLRHRPRDSGAIALIARIHANLGALDDALAWCDRAIAQDKVEPGYYVIRANVLSELGRDADAIAAMERALFLDQDCVLALYGLGCLSRRRGRHGRARCCFELALNLLGRYAPDEPVSKDEDLSAGRLAEMINVILEIEKHA